MSVRSRHLRLPSDPAHFPRLISLVDKFAHDIGASASLRYALHLVVEELSVNIMRHGYCGAVDGWIEVLLEETPNGARVRVEDAAPAFDPFADVPQPDIEAPISARAPGGIGLMLVRHVAASLSYERLPGDDEGASGRNSATVMLLRDGDNAAKD